MDGNIKLQKVRKSLKLWHVYANSVDVMRLNMPSGVSWTPLVLPGLSIESRYCMHCGRYTRSSKKVKGKLGLVGLWWQQYQEWFYS